jgi:hypothetical protein
VSKRLQELEKSSTPVEHNPDGSAQLSSVFSIHPQTVAEYDFELELGLDQ